MDVRTVIECGARTALVASTSCAAITTKIINKAFLEYSITLVAEEVAIHACSS
jgi:hypothetical protein